MDVNELLNQNELHMDQVLSAKLDELGLCSRSRDDLLAIRFLGESNVDTIERLLNTFDLKLKHSQPQ